MKNFQFILLVLLCVFSTKAIAQTETKQEDTTSMENLRGESGVDPIIIHSKITLNTFICDPKGPSGSITNMANLTLAFRKWSFGLEGSYKTLMSGNPGEGFHSNGGDLKFTLTTKIYKKGKHSFAATGKLIFPTGEKGYGSQYFSFTPAITYIYSLKPSLILAVQPQYSFHIMKDPLYPNLSLLTIKALFAKFTRTGSAYGIEIKPTINLTSDEFKIFISPFVSKALGSGFNILLLCDIPANKYAVDEGPTFQIGINRNF